MKNSAHWPLSVVLWMVNEGHMSGFSRSYGGYALNKNMDLSIFGQFIYFHVLSRAFLPILWVRRTDLNIYAGRGARLRATQPHYPYYLGSWSLP